MEKFEVTIAETEDGIHLTIRDLENFQRCDFPVKNEDIGSLSVAWMARFILGKCKETLRQTQESKSNKTAKFN